MPSGQKMGLFITLEGGEGAGKSTQAKILATWLQDQGHPCLLTREPGGSKAAESIRHLLLNQTDTPLAPMAELLLFLAARADHYHHTIRPALDAGSIVICDRFQDSTAVYQGLAGGMGAEYADAVYRTTMGNIMPDATLLLDIAPEAGLARAASTGKRAPDDRFEGKALAFHQAVREGFLARAKADAGRFRIIDAAAPMDEVQQTMRQHISHLLGAA